LMEYIETEAELETAVSRLRGTVLLAADTEAAGYHRYDDRVCLLQLSTRKDNLVIDTLSLNRLDGLAPILADPSVEVIFHDADYDLRLLQRDFGLVVRGVFDTKIAAQFVGESAFGLASLVEKYLGTRLTKAFQRADWARRPLPPEMLEYAAGDTEYLPALRDALRAALEDAGRLSWAEEEFRLEESVRWAPAEGADVAYLRLKNTRDLRPRQLAALRELYGWREGVARARDQAPFRVLTNDVLVELARRMPSSAAGLAGIPGAPRMLAERYGSELLTALGRARALAESELPERPRGPARPPPDPEFDELVERLRQVRDEVAEGLGLDRGFLMPRSQLEELARRRPTTLLELESIPGFRHWQVEAAGGELISVLKRWRG
jgi:ribonuclease D